MKRATSLVKCSREIKCQNKNKNTNNKSLKIEQLWSPNALCLSRHVTSRSPFRCRHFLCTCRKPWECIKQPLTTHGTSRLNVPFPGKEKKKIIGGRTREFQEIKSNRSERDPSSSPVETWLTVIALGRSDLFARTHNTALARSFSFNIAGIKYVEMKRKQTMSMFPTLQLVSCFL